MLSVRVFSLEEGCETSFKWEKRRKRGGRGCRVAVDGEGRQYTTQRNCKEREINYYYLISVCFWTAASKNKLCYCCFVNFNLWAISLSWKRCDSLLLISGLGLICHVVFHFTLKGFSCKSYVVSCWFCLYFQFIATCYLLLNFLFKSIRYWPLPLPLPVIKPQLRFLKGLPDFYVRWLRQTSTDESPVPHPCLHTTTPEEKLVYWWCE